MAARYAEGTSVQPEKSQGEIQGLLRRYGADGFMFGWDAGQAAIMFRVHDRNVRFVLNLPTNPDDFKLTPSKQVRTQSSRRAAMEAETRRLWRALALAIKAKLEVVESGIATFEEEFLAHIVLPDGRSFGEHALPAIQSSYEKGGTPRLALPGGQ